MNSENKVEKLEDVIPAKTGSKRIIIAGGGTGGHIFPAIAIANAIRKATTGN